MWQAPAQLLSLSPPEAAVHSDQVQSKTSGGRREEGGASTDLPNQDGQRNTVTDLQRTEPRTYVSGARPTAPNVEGEMQWPRGRRGVQY